MRALVTDAWSPDFAALRRVAPRFAHRHHVDLADARVIAPTWAAVGHELRARAAGIRGMDRNIDRNRWFQERAIGAAAGFRNDAGREVTVFAYSYAAAEIFAFAKAAGWRTVLGQIDPGIEEDRIVQRADPQGYSPKPACYWSSWRRELELADAIVVNSEWSRAGLEKEDVTHGKIAVIPLACEGPASRETPRASLPQRFSDERPLRVLFLGQIIARKGVRQLLDAIHELQAEPIEFHFVGSSAPGYERELRAGANIVWHGAVPRDQTRRHYDAADVFVFPTLSDGFGLTQLEAMSSGLPVIASRCCGDVVRDGVNGLTLDEVSPARIVAALRELRDSPARLASLQAGAAATRVPGIEDLYEPLVSLFPGHPHAAH